jgi:hypothetical protein
MEVSAYVGIKSPIVIPIKKKEYSMKSNVPYELRANEKTTVELLKEDSNIMKKTIWYALILYIYFKDDA